MNLTPIVAKFEMKDVLDKDTKIYEVTVKRGDSLAKLAHSHGSTVGIMEKLNQGARTLHPGQPLKYEKASAQQVITGWKVPTTSNVSTYYNGGGDSHYAQKLDFALSTIKMGALPPCTR